MKNFWLIKLLAVVAILLGLASLKEGSSVLFFSDEARLAAGNYVPFVLWTNFLLGFVYIFTGILLLIQNKNGYKFALIITIITGLAFILFSLHILMDRPFEVKTALAMTFRLSFWGFIVFTLKKNKNPS